MDYELTGHKSSIQCIEVNADGSTLVSGGNKGMIVWTKDATSKQWTNTKEISDAGTIFSLIINQEN